MRDPEFSAPHHPAGRTDCYHCGEAVPVGADFGIELNGEVLPMCCPGCAAVAQLIHSSGLDAYYRQREGFNLRPTIEFSSKSEHYRLYNNPGVYGEFCSDTASGQRQARLLLGGLTCAACTWLVEHRLLSAGGVRRASVNLSQSRLDVEFEPAQVELSEIFAMVEALGYSARPFQHSTQRELLEDERKQSLRALAVAGIGMMQVGMFAIALHAGDLQGMDIRYQSLLRWVALLVSTLVVVYSARGFFETAWRHLKSDILVMDLPVALAIGLAYGASVWATVTGSGQVYFDSIVMFTFFLLLGRFYEKRVRQRSGATWFDAEASLPLMVRVRSNSTWVLLPRQELQPGQRILIPAGDIVPVDGAVHRGQSSVDESAFNGESLPRPLIVGDLAYAGTVNLEQALELEVQGSFVDTRLAALQRSVEQAQFDKPALARLADRVASWFIAGILLITATTAVIWWQLQPDQALWIALSVLVVSCPCALALATPTALTSAAAAMRRGGVIVHGENALETLSRCTHLLFDKTGTLTHGRLQIARVELLGDIQENEVLEIAAAMQAFSSHPVAAAFATIATELELQECDYRVGQGLLAKHDDQRFAMGSESFCQQLMPALESSPDEPLYWVALCNERAPLAWIGLRDALRSEAWQVLEQARTMGLNVQLLSGDSSCQGPALAAELGIEDAYFGLTPDAKRQHVRQLQGEQAVVAMVGDGLNDAPVLAAANVSFAVAGATDLARTQADLVITEDRLDKVTQCLQRARQCRRILLQNFCWALGYNACGIPLAALGLVPPWAAAIGMSASSLVVLANSLRLNRPLKAA